MHLDGKKAWFFHGDVFDVSIQHTKWIAKLGGWGYDFLILVNRGLNYFLEKAGREKYSLSKKIKNSVKQALKFISDFEQTTADLAIANDFDYVICGHIHQPAIKKIENPKGSCIYLNSGDWIENLTALEYNNECWTLYSHLDRSHHLIPDETEFEDENHNIETMMGAMQAFKIDL